MGKDMQRGGMMAEATLEDLKNILLGKLKTRNLSKCTDTLSHTFYFYYVIGQCKVH